MAPLGPFGNAASADGHFDPEDTFVPEHLPSPGPFLDEGKVLEGDRHVKVHRTARELFEERGVYDMTFGYNLAKLNRDQRHPDAGLRYATDGAILLTEFTPTTPFCPQSEVLSKAVFRAWNGLSERHEFDRVRVRLAPMHHSADAINQELESWDRHLVETGELPDG
ncbi:MAG: hypothetical protein ABEJ27_05090 [Halodesulfurarchaeum sp.]